MQHDQTLAKQHTLRRHLVNWACGTGLAVAFIFVSFPQIDIWISSLFFLGDRQFILNVWEIGPILRFLFQLFFVSICLGILISFWICIRSLEIPLNLTFPKWLFLLMCLVVGPGLVANTLLKDNWGRARPHHIEQFGGPKTYTPVMVVSNQCERNCSFVSGEASMIFASLFALALLFPYLSQNLLFYGLIGGFAAGAIRLMQGGHFMSDILFSGIFMALVICAIHWLIFVKYNTYFAHKGPAHYALNRFVSWIDKKLGIKRKTEPTETKYLE